MSGCASQFSGAARKTGSILCNSGHSEIIDGPQHNAAGMEAGRMGAYSVNLAIDKTSNLLFAKFHSGTQRNPSSVPIFIRAGQISHSYPWGYSLARSDTAGVRKDNLSKHSSGGVLRGVVLQGTLFGVTNINEKKKKTKEKTSICTSRIFNRITIIIFSFFQSIK